MVRDAALDVMALLRESLKATCKEDFAPAKAARETETKETEGDEDDEDDEDDDYGNPLTSYVAAAEVLSLDPRFERCPLKERAALYCEHVRELCERHGAESRRTSRRSARSWRRLRRTRRESERRGEKRRPEGTDKDAETAAMIETADRRDGPVRGRGIGEGNVRVRGPDDRLTS